MSSGSGTDRLDRPAAAGGPAPSPARGRDRLRPAGPALALPDPPLTDADAGIRLRTWTASPGDADALAAAWADPVLFRANGAPQDRSVAAAGRWLAGDAERRASGRSLDLVVAPLDPDADDAVLGEVGLRNVDRVRRRAEVSWWIASDHRRHGLAAAAGRLVIGWALAPTGGGLIQVWARISPTNVASRRVAAATAMAQLGMADGAEIWAATRRT
jgi:RimJ/RimL family protein N-acetyltransferase